MMTLLDCTLPQVYKLARKGTIPSFKVGTAVKFVPRDVLTWFQQQ